MSAGAWRRSALGRGVDVLRRATPRLQRLYAQLPASAGLAPDATAAAHEERLLRYYRHLADHVPALPLQPTFSLVVTDEAPDPDLLAETLASLRLQVYPRWQACVPEGVPTPPGIPVTRHAGDPRGQTTGDYVIHLDPGDRLYPSALAELVRAIDLEERLTGTAPTALYTDERTIGPGGEMSGDPVFKPGWSPRLQRSGDYVGALAVYHRDLLTGAVPGDAADRHDLALRVGAAVGFCHVPHVLVQRREKPVGVVSVTPAFTGRVSVVIPTKDQPELLEACLRSVLHHTTYPDLQVVVVDNGSTEPGARAVLERIREDSRVLVVPAPGPFNFARLCNRGVAESDGDVVVLLNNDTEVLTPGWLEVLGGWAAEEGVGAVGAQLRYPDGRIQHAGLAGMAEAGTGHLFVARDPAVETPLALAQRAREVLAVTGACLAVRRTTYREVGGLDEWVVPNDSGDVDFCLRLRERGLVNVYAPEAVLLHHESPSRQRGFVDFERVYLQRRWPADLLADPYLNPNLAKSTRYEADYRFGVPEVPPGLFAEWLAAGVLPPLNPEGA